MLQALDLGAPHVQGLVLTPTRELSIQVAEPVFLWVDGDYVKAGLEKDKAAILVVLAGLRDGRKVDPGRR